MPVTVLDGLAIARLAADQNIAVSQAWFPVALPDVDLFEALRAS